MNFGVVVIGRNEGQRLQRCLKSLPASTLVVYVDSGSIDGSAEWARSQGVEVVELDMRRPFTAARARNSGFIHLRRLAPELAYVQFVDGDCELIEGWPERAVSFLQLHRDVCAVCGWRRESHPERSIYNLICDREWNGPVGQVPMLGGDVMMRTVALEAVGGYRDDLIAGEDPEVSIRLRAAGWRIWRLDAEMTRHDAAMTRFGQWWQRGVRSGYVFAQGTYLHGAPPESHFVWESRRAWLLGVWLPLACILIGYSFAPWGLAVWLIYPAHMFQKIIRSSGQLSDRVPLAFFDVMVLFPQGWGQLQFLCDRMLGRQPRLIEYK
jgi:glycosyltransferase involved in cell wall biosynthesis